MSSGTYKLIDEADIELMVNRLKGVVARMKESEEAHGHGPEDRQTVEQATAFLEMLGRRAGHITDLTPPKG